MEPNTIKKPNLNVISNIKVIEEYSITPTPASEEFSSLEPERKIEEITKKLKNQKLKRKVKKYEDLVKGLRKENQLLQENVNRFGNKRDKLMVKFTKVCRFT